MKVVLMRTRKFFYRRWKMHRKFLKTGYWRMVSRRREIRAFPKKPLIVPK